MPPRHSLAWLHVLFALSGAAGLGLQLTWTRRLTLGLGHEIPATLGVLTTFMLGLAAGAWLFDRLAPRGLRPAVSCALLEAATAVASMATLWIIPGLAALSWQLAGPAPGRGLHWTLSFLLPAVALLPATLAMGATLPAMERWISTLQADERRVAPLYAANTLGAVLGVVAAVWILQPWLGLRGTTLAFAAMNALCALGFWRAGRSSTALPEDGEHSQPTSTPRHGTTRVILTLFVTGLLGMGFEVLTVRLLGQALENTVYTYAGILAVYLLGTAGGAALRNRIAPRAETALPVLLLALAGSLVGSGWVLTTTPAAHAALRSFLGDGTGAVMASELITAAAVVALPTFLMGLLFSVLTQAERTRSRRLGTAVAWNTLGAALAPALVGLGLLPALGSRWTLVALATGYLTLLPRIRGRLWIGLAVAVTGLALLPASLHLQRVPPGTRLVALEEGAGDTVTVVETADGQRSLRVNNRFTMGGTASAAAERRHGHLPLLLHPHPRRALFLGVGTGISYAALDAHEGLTADGVELVPESVSLLGAFSPHNAFGPDLRVHVADARRFVRASDAPYDVIIADLFHPARDGAGSLYTREQFQAVRDRLAPGGLFCQWLPLFQLDEPTLRTIVGTFLDVFPHANAFLLRFNADTPVLGLVGTTEPLKFDTEWLGRRLTDPVLRDALKPLVLTEPWPFFGTWFADAAWLRALAGDAPLNTDDHPVVIFQAPRTLSGRPPPGHALLERLLDRPRPAPDALFAPPNPPADRPWLDRLKAYQRARDRYLRGLIAEVNGRPTEAEAAFLDSVRLSPDFTSGYSQLLARATLRAKSDPAAARRLLDQLIEASPDRPIARDLRTRLGL
ncbi:MAG: hypothetical protein RIS76_1145 [Verrucomicrobiota bacterium]